MKPSATAVWRVLEILLVNSRKIVKKQFFIEVGLNLAASFDGRWKVAVSQHL
ncbi:hypothetical protein ACIPLR_18620 [Herbaspirillum huttiense]|uniref:hypothetical protein n=1 Tax=Herbaspirillum huttiense TaxID=863372 RepID=UPI0037F60CD4